MRSQNPISYVMCKCVKIILKLHAVDTFAGARIQATRKQTKLKKKLFEYVVILFDANDMFAFLYAHMPSLHMSIILDVTMCVRSDFFYLSRCSFLI